MATIAENLTILSNHLEDAYTALSAKGAVMPEEHRAGNLSATIETIPTGEPDPPDCNPYIESESLSGTCWIVDIPENNYKYTFGQFYSYAGGTANYPLIDWGDGAQTQCSSQNTAFPNHTYALSGRYRINVSDKRGYIMIGGMPNANVSAQYEVFKSNPCVKEIVRWGSQLQTTTNSVTYAGTCRGLVNLTKTANFGPACKNTSYAYQGCMNLNCKGIVIQPGVTTTICMFDGCRSLEIPPETIPDTVTNCGYMFQNCYKLRKTPSHISSRCTLAHYMFYSCVSLQHLEFDALPDTITNCSYTFHGCTMLQETPTNVPTACTTCAYMFAYCRKIVNRIQAIPANVTTCASMYEQCNKNTNAPSMANANKVTTCNRMFGENTMLEEPPDCSGIVKCTDFSSMFVNCLNMKHCADLSHNTQNTGTVLMYGTWSGCTTMTGQIYKWPYNVYRTDQCYNYCFGIEDVWRDGEGNVPPDSELMPSTVTTGKSSTMSTYTNGKLRKYFLTTWGGTRAS